MNLILAKKASPDLVNDFFNNNQDIEKESLLKNGYVVQVKDAIVGCFILESIGEGHYWLKQLYITKSEATGLPVLLETILTLAKQHNKKGVYVNSHQPMVDIILESLQFSPEKDQIKLDEYKTSKGRWWSYQVS